MNMRLFVVLKLWLMSNSLMGTGNLYVVLVLYRDEETNEKKCDYLRFWSKASTSAEFHHAALRAVKRHLTGEDNHPLGRGGRVKNLRRLYVWTDGHGSTYKGFQNFGRMAQWPHSRTRRDADSDVFFLFNSCWRPSLIYSYFFQSLGCI